MIKASTMRPAATPRSSASNAANVPMIANCRPTSETDDDRDTWMPPPRVTESNSSEPWIATETAASRKAPTPKRPARAESCRSLLNAKPAAATRYRNGSVI